MHGATAVRLGYTGHAVVIMANGHVHVSDPTRHQEKSGSLASEMSMMRIAVAGTGGLARLIAHFIDQDTGHHVVFLSRTVRSPLRADRRVKTIRFPSMIIVVSVGVILTQAQEQPQLSESYQVTVVNYSDLQSLQFALRGIDTVISTVTGPNQIELIRAAVSVRVRRFAPAEFEGPPQSRPARDPLDRHRTVARQWLAYYAQHIQTTTFVCGILYERFQPGGLRQSRIGVDAEFSREGDYIMNCRTMAAQVPCYDANNDPNVTICLTAAQDVGRFVTKAIDLPQWPPELRMYGQRIAVKDLVQLVQRLKGMFILLRPPKQYTYDCSPTYSKLMVV